MKKFLILLTSFLMPIAFISTYDSNEALYSSGYEYQNRLEVGFKKNLAGDFVYDFYWEGPSNGNWLYIDYYVQEVGTTSAWEFQGTVYSSELSLTNITALKENTTYEVLFEWEQESVWYIFQTPTQSWSMYYEYYIYNISDSQFGLMLIYKDGIEHTTSSGEISIVFPIVESLTLTSSPPPTTISVRSGYDNMGNYFWGNPYFYIEYSKLVKNTRYYLEIIWCENCMTSNITFETVEPNYKLNVYSIQPINNVNMGITYWPYYDESTDSYYIRVDMQTNIRDNITGTLPIEYSINNGPWIEYEIEGEEYPDSYYFYNLEMYENYQIRFKVNDIPQINTIDVYITQEQIDYSLNPYPPETPNDRVNTWVWISTITLSLFTFLVIAGSAYLWVKNSKNKNSK